MAMAGPPRAASPFDAYAVLLCEGSHGAHESAIFGRWADRAFADPRRRVKVLPCGTASALFGMADAYGRVNRVLVLEDRDFRSERGAADECAAREINRRKRHARLIGWRALRRNEIENYLLEPDCLHPVLTEVFGCQVADIEAALDEVLPSLVPYQVGQAVLYRARQRWEETDPTPLLPNNTKSRPEWRDPQSLSSPDPALLRQKLLDNAKPLAGYGLDVDALAQDFDETSAAWAGMTQKRPEWQSDWAGKEVLSHLLMLLAARFGLPDATGGGTRHRLNFSALNNTKRGALCRERLEPILHPRLNQSFLRLLQAAPKSSPIAHEFGELETLIERYRD